MPKSEEMLLKARLEELEKIAAQVDPALKKDIERISKKLTVESQKSPLVETTDNVPESKAWKRVQLARHKDRLTTLEYISRIFDDFIELHGDRLYRDDSAIVGGLAWLGDKPVTVIGHQKGRNVKENIKRNFGMAHPEGYRKALRLMRQAEKFGRPIICFIDTPGAYCGLGAEERGQGEAIARNLFEMSDLKVPVISIVIGEGGSGGALAFGVGNEIWMLENAVYSVLSPEGFASILWKDASKAETAADIMKITAEDIHAFGLIDQVIPEDEMGVHINPEKTVEHMKELIENTLTQYGTLSAEEIVDKRYNKFRAMGMCE
jgi:acetyl-CoA carboxylase carboxyl transferase alpha subunit